jgi:hypothetical protein
MSYLKWNLPINRRFNVNNSSPPAHLALKRDNPDVITGLMVMPLFELQQVHHELAFCEFDDVFDPDTHNMLNLIRACLVERGLNPCH